MSMKKGLLPLLALAAMTDDFNKGKQRIELSEVNEIDGLDMHRKNIEILEFNIDYNMQPKDVHPVTNEKLDEE